MTGIVTGVVSRIFFIHVIASLGICPSLILTYGPEEQPIKRIPLWSKTNLSLPKVEIKLMPPLSLHPTS
jgi:hypothetical protein